MLLLSIVFMVLQFLTNGQDLDQTVLRSIEVVNGVDAVSCKCYTCVHKFSAVHE